MMTPENFSNNERENKMPYSQIYDTQDNDYMLEESQEQVIDRYFGEMILDTSGNIPDNLLAVYLELNWFLQVLWYRYKNPGNKNDIKTLEEEDDFNGDLIKLPLLPEESHYAQWLKKHKIYENAPERLLFATAMALSLNDAMFIALLALTQEPVITVFVGGQTQNNERRFTPSLQTVSYLLTGTDLKKQIDYQLHLRQQQKHAVFAQPQYLATLYRQPNAIARR